MIKGNKYIIPCAKFSIIKKIELTEDDFWEAEYTNNYINSFYKTKKIEYLVPIIDFLHDDKENGQEMPHYHMDSRFIENDRKYISRIYPHEHKDFEIVYQEMTCIKEIEDNFTHISFIKKSKFGKCMKNNKCLHRGYDLSNIKPDENGIITCPLHNLKYRNNILL